MELFIIGLLLCYAIVTSILIYVLINRNDELQNYINGLELNKDIGKYKTMDLAFKDFKKDIEKVVKGEIKIVIQEIGYSKHKVIKTIHWLKNKLFDNKY